MDRKKVNEKKGIGEPRIQGRNHMSLMSTEQHVSAQVWTCTRCGGEDPKSCGCSAATATSRELAAAKKEAHRQAVNKSAAKKREESTNGRHLPTVENVEVSPTTRKPRELPFDPHAARDAFLIRADHACRFAFYEGKIDAEIIEAAHDARDCWVKLCNALEAGKKVLRDDVDC
jgi:hypothetical protein